MAGHERKTNKPTGGADETPLFFDEKTVPVEVIAAPNPDAEGLAPDRYKVIGEKVTYRLAHWPGSYVVLEYVRPVTKRCDTQTLSCPPAPVGVIDGSRGRRQFRGRRHARQVRIPSALVSATPAHARRRHQRQPAVADPADTGRAR